MVRVLLPNCRNILSTQTATVSDDYPRNSNINKSHLWQKIYNIYKSFKERQQSLDILRVKLDFNLHVSAMYLILYNLYNTCTSYLTKSRF